MTTVLGSHLAMPIQIPSGPSLPTVGTGPLKAAGDQVDVKTSAYKRMEGKWQLLHDLLGGTEAMREAAETWLPREHKEEPDAYNVRLNRSILYNALETTFDNLVSKPFSKSITVDEEDLPAQIQPMVQDVTKSGVDLTTFVKDVFRKGLEYGLTHILIDYPAMDPTATLADEIEVDARPTFLRIDPPDMLGWKTRRTVTGTLKLEQIRFREWRVMPEGSFGDTEIEYIRVYNAPPLAEAEGTWELWRRGDDGEFMMESSGTHTFPGVPLVTFYTNRTGFMEGLPPFEDLMWLNVAHWQTSSDVRNTLRMVLSAIFFAIGIPADALSEMTFGPNMFLKSESEGAQFGFVEHSGSGLNAGRTELAELEARMEQLGLKPLIERSSRSTATGKIIDETRTSTDIQAWVRVLESSLLVAFQMAAGWVGEALPDNFSVNIFNDFGIAEKASEDLAELRNMRSMSPPTLDIRTYLKEVKRRGLLSDDVDIEEVIAAIEDELMANSGTPGDLTDENGNPIDENGNPIPLDENGDPVQMDENGNPIPADQGAVA